jgi:Transglycosylase-like domain
VRRTTVIMLILTTLILSEEAQAKRPAWLPPLWYGIAMCEQGSTVGETAMWRVRGSTYSGAFGFYNGTWSTYAPNGYPVSAADATPWQQYQVALNVAFRGNTNARYGHHGPVGMTAWGSYNNGCYRTYMN